MPRLRKASKPKAHPYKKRWFSGGLTLPGYNYLGPFNAKDNGPPTRHSDKAAQAHDDEYKTISDRNWFITPYVKYNNADDTFLDAIKDDKDYGANIARSIFNAKKRFAPRLDPHLDIKRARRDASLFNSPPRSTDITSSMPEGMGSGLEAGLKETPIDEVMQVHRGPPNYTFASLPFYYDQVDDVTKYNQQWTWRMTSPYDVSCTATTVDHNVGAGATQTVDPDLDSADGSAQKCRWFNFYAGMYKYYHVVACKWHYTLENMSTEPIWVHQYYSNETDRPAMASNADMMYWPDTKSHYVGSAATAITSAGEVEALHLIDNTANDEDATTAGVVANYETGNHVAARGPSPILKLSGEYRPGDYNREIRLDSEVENWTACTTNPTLSERLSFRVRPQWDAQNLVAGDAASYDRPLNYRWVIRLEYLVEFKELLDGLRYPIQHQPMTVTISALQGVN